MLAAGEGQRGSVGGGGQRQGSSAGTPGGAAAKSRDPSDNTGGRLSGGAGSPTAKAGGGGAATGTTAAVSGATTRDEGFVSDISLTSRRLGGARLSMLTAVPRRLGSLSLTCGGGDQHSVSAAAQNQPTTAGAGGVNALKNTSPSINNTIASTSSVGGRLSDRIVTVTQPSVPHLALRLSASASAAADQQGGAGAANSSGGQPTNSNNKRKESLSGGGGGGASAISAVGAERFHESVLWANVLKEEVLELVGARRLAEAAELLATSIIAARTSGSGAGGSSSGSSGIAASSAASSSSSGGNADTNSGLDVVATFGRLACLPVLLELEATITEAIVDRILSCPVSPLLLDTAHVPLLRLLLYVDIRPLIAGPLPILNVIHGNIDIAMKKRTRGMDSQLTTKNDTNPVAGAAVSTGAVSTSPLPDALAAYRASLGAHACVSVATNEKQTRSAMFMQELYANMQGNAGGSNRGGYSSLSSMSSAAAKAPPRYQLAADLYLRVCSTLLDEEVKRLTISVQSSGGCDFRYRALQATDMVTTFIMNAVTGLSVLLESSTSATSSTSKVGTSASTSLNNNRLWSARAHDKSAAAALQLPPYAGVPLWVRDRLTHLVTQILTPLLLSLGHTQPEQDNRSSGSQRGAGAAKASNNSNNSNSSGNKSNSGGISSTQQQVNICGVIDAIGQCMDYVSSIEHVLGIGHCHTYVLQLLNETVIMRLLEGLSATATAAARAMLLTSMTTTFAQYTNDRLAGIFVLNHLRCAVPVVLPTINASSSHNNGGSINVPPLTIGEWSSSSSTVGGGTGGGGGEIQKRRQAIPVFFSTSASTSSGKGSGGSSAAITASDAALRYMRAMDAAADVGQMNLQQNRQQLAQHTQAVLLAQTIGVPLNLLSHQLFQQLLRDNTGLTVVSAGTSGSASASNPAVPGGAHRRTMSRARTDDGTTAGATATAKPPSSSQPHQQPSSSSSNSNILSEILQWQTLRHPAPSPRGTAATSSSGGSASSASVTAASLCGPEGTNMAPALSLLEVCLFAAGMSAFASVQQQQSSSSASFSASNAMNAPHRRTVFDSASDADRTTALRRLFAEAQRQQFYATSTSTTTAAATQPTSTTPSTTNAVLLAASTWLIVHAQPYLNGRYLRLLAGGPSTAARDFTRKVTDILLLIGSNNTATSSSAPASDPTLAANTGAAKGSPSIGLSTAAATAARSSASSGSRACVLRSPSFIAMADMTIQELALSYTTVLVQQRDHGYYHAFWTRLQRFWLTLTILATQPASSSSSSAGAFRDVLLSSLRFQGITSTATADVCYEDVPFSLRQSFLEATTKATPSSSAASTAQQLTQTLTETFVQGNASYVEDLSRAKKILQIVGQVGRDMQHSLRQGIPNGRRLSSVLSTAHRDDADGFEVIENTSGPSNESFLAGGGGGESIVMTAAVAAALNQRRVDITAAGGGMGSGRNGHSPSRSQSSAKSGDGGDALLAMTSAKRLHDVLLSQVYALNGGLGGIVTASTNSATTVEMARWLACTHYSPSSSSVGGAASSSASPSSIAALLYFSGVLPLSLLSASGIFGTLTDLCTIYSVVSAVALREYDAVGMRHRASAFYQLLHERAAGHFSGAGGAAATAGAGGPPTSAPTRGALSAATSSATTSATPSSAQRMSSNNNTASSSVRNLDMFHTTDLWRRFPTALLATLTAAFSTLGGALEALAVVDRLQQPRPSSLHKKSTNGVLRLGPVLTTDVAVSFVPCSTTIRTFVNQTTLLLNSESNDYSAGGGLGQNAATAAALRRRLQQTPASRVIDEVVNLYLPPSDAYAGDGGTIAGAGAYAPSRECFLPLPTLKANRGLLSTGGVANVNGSSPTTTAGNGGNSGGIMDERSLKKSLLKSVKHAGAESFLVALLHTPFSTNQYYQRNTGSSDGGDQGQSSLTGSGYAAAGTTSSSTAAADCAARPLVAVNATLPLVEYGAARLFTATSGGMDEPEDAAAVSSTLKVLWPSIGGAAVLISASKRQMMATDSGSAPPVTVSALPPSFLLHLCDLIPRYPDAGPMLLQTHPQQNATKATPVRAAVGGSATATNNNNSTPAEDDGVFAHYAVQLSLHLLHFAQSSLLGGGPSRERRTNSHVHLMTLIGGGGDASNSTASSFAVGGGSSSAASTEAAAADALRRAVTIARIEDYVNASSHCLFPLLLGSCNTTNRQSANVGRDDDVVSGGGSVQRPPLAPLTGWGVALTGAVGADLERDACASWPLCARATSSSLVTCASSLLFLLGKLFVITTTAPQSRSIITCENLASVPFWLEKMYGDRPPPQFHAAAAASKGGVPAADIAAAINKDDGLKRRTRQTLVFFAVFTYMWHPLLSYSRNAFTDPPTTTSSNSKSKAGTSSSGASSSSTQFTSPLSLLQRMVLSMVGGSTATGSGEGGSGSNTTTGSNNNTSSSYLESSAARLCGNGGTSLTTLIPTCAGRVIAGLLLGTAVADAACSASQTTAGDGATTAPELQEPMLSLVAVYRQISQAVEYAMVQLHQHPQQTNNASIGVNVDTVEKMPALAFFADAKAMAQYLEGMLATLVTTLNIKHFSTQSKLSPNGNGGGDDEEDEDDDDTSSEEEEADASESSSEEEDEESSDEESSSEEDSSSDEETSTSDDDDDDEKDKKKKKREKLSPAQKEKEKLAKRQQKAAEKAKLKADRLAMKTAAKARAKEQKSQVKLQRHKTREQQKASRKEGRAAMKRAARRRQQEAAARAGGVADCFIGLPQLASLVEELALPLRI